MSYRIQDTKWKFTAPQEGEVDSAEKKADTLREIDQAIPHPGILAQLTSRGVSPLVPDVSDPNNLYYDEEFAKTLDETWFYDEYQDKWVTTVHYHPTPDSVPHADHSTESDHAKEADHSDVASRLDPGFSVNGHHTDGATNITIKLDDIPDSFRVWYGKEEPTKNAKVPKKPREKDLYVKIT